MMNINELLETIENYHINELNLIMNKIQQTITELNNKFLKNCQNGDLENIKYLVENGANINAYMDDALRLSAGNGHLDVVKYLIENGADINILSLSSKIKYNLLNCNTTKRTTNSCYLLKRKVKMGEKYYEFNNKIIIGKFSLFFDQIETAFRKSLGEIDFVGYYQQI